MSVVIVSGTDEAKVIESLKGEKGDQGIQGEKGDKGDPGDSADGGVGVPLKRFGTPVGSDWTRVLDNACSSGEHCILLPDGEIDVERVLLAYDCDLIGLGRNRSAINVRGIGNIHGLQVKGSASLGRGNDHTLARFKLNYAGAGQTRAGTGPGQNNWSGIYFAPSDADEATGAGGTIDQAVFFASLTRVWSKNNGRDGIAVRRGANANVFDLIQADKNGRYGVHHYTDGFGTYGNYFRAGQASYNTGPGWMFANGHEITAHALYAELNGTPTNTDTDSYTSTLIDYHFGDNCVDSWFQIGSIYGNLLSDKAKHVRLPAFNPSRIKVLHGGRLLYGTF
jgi:hypothetical protein